MEGTNCNNMNTHSSFDDNGQYSRQIAVYGAETQGKLMKMKVFIHGVTGVFYFVIRIVIY